MNEDRTPRRAALVTGGARRIGAAIVRALAAQGYAVAIHVRGSRPDADALTEEIVKRGGQAVVIAADLARHEDVLAIVPAATAALGPLSLLVNNASEFEGDGFGDLDRVQFDRHLAINLRAPIFLAERFAAQSVPETDPAIVNITDQRVLKPTPLSFSYSVSKSALHAATVMMAQALAPNIRVNAVAPGPILPSPRQTAQDFARQAGATPLGRGAESADVAQAVLYLARARGVTGQTIAVDGGQHVAWRTPDVSGIAE